MNHFDTLITQEELMVSGSDDFTMFLWNPAKEKKSIARLTGNFFWTSISLILKHHRKTRLLGYELCVKRKTAFNCSFWLLIHQATNSSLTTSSSRRTRVTSSPPPSTSRSGFGTERRESFWPSFEDTFRCIWLSWQLLYCRVSPIGIPDFIWIMRPW